MCVCLCVSSSMCVQTDVDLREEYMFAWILAYVYYLKKKKKTKIIVGI